MTPLEALHEATTMALLSSAPIKPGAVVSRLRGDVRDALQRLTSDDALKLRPVGD